MKKPTPMKIINVCCIAFGLQVGIAAANQEDQTPGDDMAVKSKNIEIIAPARWQVIQRDDLNQGRVHVKITAPPWPIIEARLVLMEKTSGSATDWLALRAGSIQGTFEGIITAQGGGWYRLELRTRDGDRVIDEANLPNIGVGEVFVTAGQSNSSNYGCARLKAQEDRVAAYGNGQWQPAADPMPGAKGDGGSPWCPLGDLLVKQLNVPVAFAAVGYHGVQAEAWLPEHEAYPRLEKVLKELGLNSARAVLWHQGEADNGAGTTARQYYQTMKDVIAASQETAGYDITWFVARASFVPARYDPPAETSRAVRGAQARLWRNGLALQGPDTDDMRGPEYRCHDDIHMNEHGLITHAQRWFDQLMRQIFPDKEPIHTEKD